MWQTRSILFEVLICNYKRVLFKNRWSMKLKRLASDVI